MRRLLWTRRIDRRAPSPSSVSLSSVRVSLGGHALAVVSGALVAAPFLFPACHALAWVSLLPLLVALERARSGREAALFGFSSGFVANFLGFYWLVHTIHVFGGFALPLAVFFYSCLTLYSASQFVLFAVGFRRLGPGPLGLAPPLLWTALEFLYPNLFPWRLANSQMRVPLLLQVGDLGGPYPLSFVLVWFSSSLLLLGKRPRRLAPLGACLGAVGLVLAYGSVRWTQVERALAASEPLRVALVQGNVSIEHKRDAAYFEVNVERYRELSRDVQDRVDLLVWPETVAQWWTPADARELAPNEHPFPDLRTHLVYGGLAYRYVEGRAEPETFNSAFHLGPDGRVLGRYDKHILMPFGEYLPGASLFPSLKELSPNTGDYTPGRGVVLFRLPRTAVGPLICYEDVVTDIPREATRAGAELLLNILNDAWFGDTAGPHEHLALALWRSVENRRYLLRAANTGVTSIVDPFGRVVDQLGTFEEGVLVAEVRPLRLRTLYTRMGDVFAWSVTAVLVLLLVRNLRQRRGGG
ncbi:MAG: apolipoprotein N-acyltransferase [Candidatus Binatia bacterium]|nr:MAG: apolipoprotein N-acyltransferase [Candidatus Binatia bacterium]